MPGSFETPDVEASSCRQPSVQHSSLTCGHSDAVIVDSLPDEMPIPYVADKLRCSECRSKKINNLHNLSH